MFINEVCKKSSLTKKAIEYYEKQELVHPQIGENGYRNYSDKDLSTLMEISVLRSLGLSISEIKIVFGSSNKSLALSKYKYLMDLKRQRVLEQQKCLELLIENYNIDKVMEYIESNFSCSFTIKEKLVQSFPGVYGIYLSIHFGQFLSEKIDSDEKEEAFTKIVHFLDNIHITNQLEQYLESSIPLMEHEEIEKMNTTVLNAIGDIDNYILTNKHSIEKYIEFRNSEEYKSTAAYKMQQLLLEFQQSNGYYEIFITNLKILSSTYRDYLSMLQEANELFIKKYPQTEKFF
ncbi:MerR family transcriptional regulator [Paenibacillus sp. 7124]|uniref:MerR family transcriptional regulator n=1 Tax=Paenibacillus apii TaxID=1850370 RepID=A0A6M1PEF8_9BACL|nr:MerR family transcriptional regulator [Paenibacillus apii]NGM80944.1 MerR family transcriptional regulator [Paenibacillus apii]